jgi:16S rRNA (guanine527-N7)-methyltransferase
MDAFQARRNAVTAEIQKAFDEAGLTGLPESSYQQFAAYLGLLLRWNARLSLTAIREPEQIIRRHFVESAFAAQHLPADIESLLDYGSGAGFPGIPIAICRPEIRVTLAEAQGKKAAFLREAVRTVGTATTVYDGRVGAMPQGNLFSAVSLRAVEKMEKAIPTAIRRSKRYLILFTTRTQEPNYRQATPELEWMEPISLPNSERMILAIGNRTVKL